MLNIDRLIDRIDGLGNPSVVGLDPSLSMMPDALAREMYDAHGMTPLAVSEMFLLYNKTIIDAIADIVPAVKPQIAMYETYGADGIAAYIRTCEYASDRGLYVIGDIKRGDISSTASAYAAHLSGAELGIGVGAASVLDSASRVDVTRVDVWREDAITVNPYFGTDGIEPFTRACLETGKSVFVLVKTSNRSSAELQDIHVRAGTALQEADMNPPGSEDVGVPVLSRRGSKLYERVAEYVEAWGGGLVGARGYSAVGAVVGATHPEVGRALRNAHPRMFFLVPGYGAQGARARDLAGFFDASGRGCVVNSSRGIIAAWRRSADGEGIGAAAHDVDRALSVVASRARAAALEMSDALRAAIPNTP
jgi:orotidine-5'-phosphate decarboxylase